MATSTSEIIGAAITTGIPGTWLDRPTRLTLERIQPSGVILFRRNVESIDQLRGLTDELHSLPSRPLVSIDHEGGRIVRVGTPFTDFPAARSIRDDETAEAVGRAMGLELASAGIDIDFAPVLDVDSNPANPIIGERAFASSPHEVARLALAFARGLRASGIIPCGKHFPGHGDTDSDSHLELPVVGKSRQQLDEIELVPFRAAAEQRIPLLMTAHVLYPALDPLYPATLSRAILHDLLRNEIGYTGIVVSDDLEMRAVSSTASVADAAVASLKAGCDWLLICNDFANTVRTAARLEHALESGELSQAALQSSADRIHALRRPHRPRIELPCAEHAALRDRIAAASG